MVNTKEWQLFVFARFPICHLKVLTCDYPVKRDQADREAGHVDGELAVGNPAVVETYNLAFLHDGGGDSWKGLKLGSLMNPVKLS